LDRNLSSMVLKIGDGGFVHVVFNRTPRLPTGGESDCLFEQRWCICPGWEMKYQKRPCHNYR